MQDTCGKSYHNLQQTLEQWNTLIFIKNKIDIWGKS